MIEIRLNEDGSLDEIVGKGPFHLEQLDDDEWFLSLGDCRMIIGGDLKDYEDAIKGDALRLILTPIETDDWLRERDRVLTGQNQE